MFAFLRRFAWFKRDESPRSLALRAIQYGNFEQAEVLLTALIVETQKALPAQEGAFLYNKRGIARVQRGLRDQAREDFEAALTLMKNYAPALTNLGNLSFEDERLDEAIDRYEAALRADDDYATAHFNLSAAYKRAGRHADAVREFRRSQRGKKRRLF
jgi:tetratricopeptide (TPR) repeat protein